MSGPGQGENDAEFYGRPQRRGWTKQDRVQRIVGWLIVNREMWDSALAISDYEMKLMAVALQRAGLWSHTTYPDDIVRSLNRCYMPAARAALERIDRR